VGKFKTYVAAV